MLSRVTYTVSGGNRDYSVPQGYLAKSDISATDNGTPVTFTWLNSTTIRLDSTPTNDHKIRIYRNTPLNNVAVDFVDGANLTEADLDKSYRQAFFSVQEFSDRLDFWEEWLQNQVISGGDLPPVYVDNSFLVSYSNTWVVKSLADTKTLLGISSTQAYTTIPNPTGEKVVVYSDGTANTFSLLTLDDLGTALKLGTIAALDVEDFPLISLTAGTDVGDIVQLVNLSTNPSVNTPGLPAINGSQLTSLPKKLHLLATLETAYNVNGGGYTSTPTPVQRALTNIRYNEITGASLSGGNIRLPKGKYIVRARSKCRVNAQTAKLFIFNGDGTDVSSGSTGASIPVYGNGDDIELFAEARVDFSATEGAASRALEFRVGVTGNDANTYALGTAHGVSDWGNNTYLIVEIEWLPTT